MLAITVVILLPTMSETAIPDPPGHTEKAPCKFGAKCKRKKCKYAHPLAAAAASTVTDITAVQHDPVEPTTQEAPSTVQAPMPHYKKKKKKMKNCKFGNACHRQNCQFLHPTTTVTEQHDEEMTPLSSSDGPTTSEPILPTVEEPVKTTLKKSPKRRKGSGGKQHSYSSAKQEQDIKIEILENSVDDDDKALVNTTNSNVPSDRKPKATKHSNKRCYWGTKCRRRNCPFQHPQDTVALSKEDGHAGTTTAEEEEQVIAMVGVETLEAKMLNAEIPLAIELEDSMVAQAAAAQQEQQTSSPGSKKKRRNKRDKANIEARRRQQEEQDRLVQQEEERLRLQKEEDELFEQLAQEEEQRRLSADQARIEIQQIRQDLAAKEEAVRHVEELKDPDRVRAEHEALERFKKVHEEQKKSEEAARRLQEEERMRVEGQEELVRRERENEAELRRLAQEQENTKHRSKSQAKEDARRREKAVKVQQDIVQDEANDEERERYKAERNAAKKERRRLEKEAKVQQELTQQEPKTCQSSPECKTERSVSFSPSPTGSNEENVGHANSQEAVEDEADKKRRWAEELRRQKERAAEKKAHKQKLRRERMLQDHERQTQERIQFWRAEIADEKKAVELLVQLCGAEFCRKNPDVDRQTLLADADTRLKLEEAAQETYRSICKATIHSRIVVKGMKQQDLNDRTGTIQSWDEGKGKFYVGLDTKKGKNTQYLYLLPENLEALPLNATRKGKKKGDPVHMVFIAPLFAENELMVDVYKSELDELKKAASLDEYLDALMQDRDCEDREAKELEEEELRQEQEARRRRAEQRHRENEEWESRQRAYAEQKVRYQEWHREQKEEQRAAAEARARDERESYYESEQHRRSCHCPRCEFENMFFGGFGSGGGGRGGGPGIFFSFGAGGPDIFFSFGEDDDYDEDCEDQWDRQWEQMHEEELEQKNLEAAETLGVEVDASDAEIKRVFRKKARKYHPDSYRAENHEDGMTKVEAEEHFKELSSAYDHLMSNFDDESDED